jgi:hypothetical protein
MSSLEPKRKRERTVDVTAWVLCTTIVILATLDLLVWASMRNVPNPISKFIAEQASWISTPAVHHASR